MRKILDTHWINGRSAIGIVLTEDEFKQIAYIGVCEGNNIKLDELYVMDWGTKMTKNQAIGFFGNLINEKTYKK